MKTHYSFSSRLSLYVIVVTAILFIVAMFLVETFSRSIITEGATQNAKNMLDAKVGEIEKILSNVESAVQNSVWVIKENADSADQMYKVTSELVKDNRNIMGSAVAFIPGYFLEISRCYSPYCYFDEDSVLVRSQLGTENYNYPEKEWFKVPLERRAPYWCEPYFDEGGGEAVMTTYSCPVKDSLDNIFAIVTADVDLRNLTSIMNSGRTGEDDIVAVISNQGKFVVYPDSSFIMKQSLTSIVDEYMVGADAFIGKIAAGEKGIDEFYFQGKRCFCVYGPVSNGWSVLVLCSYDEVLADLNTMNIIFQLVIIIGLILLYIFSRSAIKKISKPITEFSDYALKIKDGNLNAELPVIESNDELKTLCDSLGEMQESLRQLKSTTIAKERFESELNIARKIQLGMVPKDFPPFLNAIMIPAKEVGGDFYDFMIRGDYLYFAIGDVTGKGVPAALFMAITKSAFRFISSLNLKIEEIVERINNSVCDGNSTSMFVTLFVGKLNMKTGVLNFCNAGHNPIVLVPSTGKVQFLQETPNLAVGLFSDFKYQGQTMNLEPGTRLILYTDGVTEAETSEKDLYGDDRLLEFAENTRALDSSEQVSAQLLQSVRDFTDGAEQNDDITIMTIDYGKEI